MYTVWLKGVTDTSGMPSHLGHTEDEWGTKKKKKIVIEAYDLSE